MPVAFTPQTREHMLEVARRMLEDGGPEAIQARRLSSEVGASTQAVYTLFGGMPGLFEALVRRGLIEFAAAIREVAETDDPVADFFAQGYMYVRWALAHPQQYRLMFGLTGGGLRSMPGLETTFNGGFAAFPEGRAAMEVMVGSLERVLAAERIRPIDPVDAAGMFLSATHGYVLLELGGLFAVAERDFNVLAPLGVNLMVSLGDAREAAQRSFADAMARVAA